MMNGADSAIRTEYFYSILGYWKTDEEFETSMCFLSVHNAQRELRTGYFYYIIEGLSNES